MRAPPKISLRLPPLWQRFALAEGSRVLVHAALNVRAERVLCALALVAAVETALVVQDPSILRTFLTDCKVRVRGTSSILQCQAESATVWVVDDVQKVPDTAQCLMVARADLLRGLPRRFAQEVLVGRMPTRGSWWDQRLRGEELEVHRWAAPVVTRQFPDQAAAVDVAEPDYQREMMLADVEPRLQSFRVFARARLKIDTQKGAQFLTPLQQAEAERQLGRAWSTGRAGTPTVTFEPSRLQSRFAAIRRQGQRRGFTQFITLKYRRGGFTSYLQGRLYQLCATQPSVAVATLADTLDRTKRVFSMASRFHANDPRAPRLISDSKTALEMENGSRMMVGTAGGRATFRGDALRRAHGTEVAWWCRGPKQQEKVSEVMAGVLGAVEGGEVDLESTACGREWFCQTYRDAKSLRTPWWPIFLRWFDDAANVAPPGSYDEGEILETLTDVEKGLVERHSLSPGQIAFRRSAELKYGRLFPQEMPEDDESCFLTTGLRFFDVVRCYELREWLKAQCDKSGWKVKQWPGGTEVRTEPPMPGVQYCAGADTSEGKPGSDPNGVGILRRDTGKQVAWVYGLFEPEVLAEHAVRMCRDYNEALLGVEREAMGHAMLLRLKQIGYYRPHFKGGPLYYHAGSKESQASSWKPGWSTNEVTRPQALDQLHGLVNDAPLGTILHDEFLGQCLSFGMQGGGKYEADSGAHDDAVMMWAIANAMRSQKQASPSFDYVEFEPWS